MKQLKQAISGRLGKQFAIQIIIFSSFFTLLSTSVQLILDYKSDMSRIDQQFTVIKSSQVPSLALGLWAMDNAQVDVHLDGLLQLPDVEHVALLEDSTARWELGEKKSKNTRSYSYPLTFERSARSDPILLGELVVTVSIDNVYDRLINRASIILISNGIKTFVVAGFIMFLIWFRVTRHLADVTDYVSQLDLKKVHSPLALKKKRRSKTPDEFDVVSDAINLMHSSLIGTFQELQAAEDNLKALLEERELLLDKERLHKEELEVKVQERTQKLRQSEQELKRSHHYLRHILETSPIAVGVYNPKLQKLTYSNKSCAHLFGYNITEWLQHDPTDSWKNRHDRESAVQEYRRQGRLSTREVLLKRKDNSEFWALLTWEKILFGEQKQILFWIVDINDQKATQLQLALARDEAEQATQFKSEFLANMSHEIRTPMNAVVGFSHLALQTDLTSQQHDYVSKIQMAGHNLLRVINDILDLSRIEAGKMTVESVSFSLDDVLEHLCDLLRLKAEEKGLEILLFHPWDMPRGLKGDPLRLGQVLTNLLGNAIKFTEKGEVSLRVEEVDRSDLSITLNFCIEDTGIGLSEQELSRLFQQFSQADSSTTRRYGGSGLGLVICKQLIELMGGEISVSSQKGIGSKFSFTCQLEIDAKTDVIPSSKEQLMGRRVLVVDDSEASREVLSSIVCNMGMYCYTVCSGEDAIAELERSQATEEPDYDLLLLDWHMPGLDGMECAQQIKTMSGTAKLPALVMITAHHREDLVNHKHSEFLDGFLLKPVSPTLLMSAISNALGVLEDHELRSRHDQMGNDDAINRMLGCHALVVEDNVINQQIALEMLQGLGMHVSLAGDGLQALNKAREQLFDLVLMDIQMPVMDGLEATRKIRLIPAYRQVPIIAMTANAMEEDRQRSLDAGMDDHIPKPIQPDQLYSILSQWVGPGVRHAGPERVSESLEIEGLDCQMALARLNGNQALYDSLLEKFMDQHKGFFETLDSEQILMEKGVDAVHTYTGLVGNLGADRLCALSRRLEQETRSSKQESILETLKQCRNEAAAVESAIERYLKKRVPAEKSGDVVLDYSAFVELMSQLRPMLLEGNARAQQLSSELAGVVSDCEELAELQEAVAEFEFTAALKSLDKLSQKLASHRAEVDEVSDGEGKGACTDR